MKLGIAHFVLGILLSTPAGAAISDCLSIDEGLSRLACYDREAGYHRDVSTTRGAGDWTVQSKQSKIDDSTNVFLYLDSTDETSCRYKNGNHRIWIACRENTTSLWVTFANCFMADLNGKGRVTYRLDTEKADIARMRESNDNMALGLWNGGSSIPFIKRMFGHDHLLLRATPFSDSAVTGEYNISGLEEAIKPLREACHW